jgi:hypothetical protein
MAEAGATKRRDPSHRTTLSERDVTGVVESMKPRCRFRRRREVPRAAVVRKPALFFGTRPAKRGDRPRDGFQDRLRFAPAPWNDRLGRNSEMRFWNIRDVQLRTLPGR